MTEKLESEKIEDIGKDNKIPAGNGESDNGSVEEHTIDSDIGTVGDSKLEDKKDAEKPDKGDKDTRAEKRKKYQREYKRKQRQKSENDNKLKPEKKIVKFKETAKVDTKKAEVPEVETENKKDYKIFIAIFVILAVGAVIIYFSLKTDSDEVSHTAKKEKRGWYL